MRKAKDVQSFPAVALTNPYPSHFSNPIKYTGFTENKRPIQKTSLDPLLAVPKKSKNHFFWMVIFAFWGTWLPLLATRIRVGWRES